MNPERNGWIKSRRSAWSALKATLPLLAISMFICAHTHAALCIVPNQTPLDFGAVEVGKTTQVELTQVVPTSLLPTICEAFNYFITGKNSGDFVIVSNACDGACLRVGQTCTFTIEFTPSAAGPRIAELDDTISCFNDDGSPCVPACSGYAIPMQGNVDVSVTPQPPNAALITVNVDTVTLLIEGLGPSLGGVADPVLEVRDAIGNVIELNNDWQDTQSSAIAGTGHAPGAGFEKESAMLLDLQKGSYTAVEEGNCGSAGAGKIVVYETAPHKLDTPVETSASTTTGIDTDGDSLPDPWEKEGMSVVDAIPGATPPDVCYPGDVRAKAGGAQFIDLKKMGANAEEKDIFVHADWMAPNGNQVFEPEQDAIALVRQAFAKAPVQNAPGQPPGIALHVDLGPNTPMTDNSTWGQYSKATVVPWQNIIANFVGDTGPNPTFEAVFKPINFYPSKRQYVFHYALFGDRFDAGTGFADPLGSAGVAQRPGTDLFLAFGSGDIFQSTFFQTEKLVQAGDFMHELGHNLGLRHGGDVDTNNIPNYRSVMNYLYIGTGRQTPRLAFPGLEDLFPKSTIDYGVEALSPIYEFAVNEQQGIGLPKGNIIRWQPVKAGTTYQASGPGADWNWSSGGLLFEPAPYPFDLNGDGIQDVLFDHQDWLGLVYGVGQIGTMGSSSRAATKLAADLFDEPITNEVAAAIPQSTLDAEAVSPNDIFTVSPREGPAPLSVHFDGNGSTAVVGSIATWLWDFGDGTTGSGVAADHTYSLPGNYFVELTVIDGAGNVNVAPVSQTIQATASAPSARLANISTRLNVGTGDNVLIGGLIVTGTDAKKVMIRAIGPSLPLDGKLADPILELHDSSGAVLGSNDNWVDSPEKQAMIESSLAPTNDLESALIATLSANSSAYTVIVRGVNDTTGVGLVEAYDLDDNANSQMANISTRGLVQTGDNVMIGGFIISGNSSNKVIVRAIGPSLPLSGPLADPTLELHNSNGDLIGSNDNWRSDQEAEINGTGLQPTNDKESAIVTTLDLGAYTAIIRGVNNTTGVALVEVYDLD